MMLSLPSDWLHNIFRHLPDNDWQVSSFLHPIGYSDDRRFPDMSRVKNNRGSSTFEQRKGEFAVVRQWQGVS